jgi:hypothetical protein
MVLLAGVLVGFWAFWGSVLGGLDSAFGAEAEVPTAASILRSVRAAQMSMRESFQGRLRRGGTTVPYRFEMEGPMFRYEFPNGEEKGLRSLVVRFGLLDATLEAKDGRGHRMPVKFQDEVLGMGVAYEDLALRFLTWSDSALEGTETLMFSKCWKIRVKAPKGSSSAYKEVLMWISDRDRAFLKSEAYGEKGELLRRLTVRSVQSVGQATILKQLRAESPALGGEPSYLEVDGERVARPPR